MECALVCIKLRNIHLYKYSLVAIMIFQPVIAFVFFSLQM